MNVKHEITNVERIAPDRSANRHRPRKMRRAGKRPKLAAEVVLLANLLKRSGNIVIGRRLGLSTIAWSLIGQLGHRGPMTQTEIVEEFLVDKGQLSRAAVLLARRGLIRRQRRTWRSIELSLAPKGQRLFSNIERLLQRREKKLVHGITAQDMGVVYRSLALINANAARLLAQETGD